jgi:hypothetical protein
VEGSGGQFDADIVKRFIEAGVGESEGAAARSATLLPVPIDVIVEGG